MIYLIIDEPLGLTYTGHQESPDMTLQWKIDHLELS